MAVNVGIPSLGRPGAPPSQTAGPGRVGAGASTTRLAVQGHLGVPRKAWSENTKQRLRKCFLWAKKENAGRRDPSASPDGAFDPSLLAVLSEGSLCAVGLFTVTGRELGGLVPRPSRPMLAPRAGHGCEVWGLPGGRAAGAPGGRRDFHAGADLSLSPSIQGRTCGRAARSDPRPFPPAEGPFSRVRGQSR